VGQKPINPLSYGISVKDWVRPRITGIKVYPASELSRIEGSRQPQKYQTAGWGEKYRLKDKKSITVKGPFYIGVSTYDLLNDTYNKNGVYSIKISFDDHLYFHLKADEFSYSETRYINALIDYKSFSKDGEPYIISRVLPNNPLSLYEYIKDSGVFIPQPGIRHEVKIEVEDANNNLSVLRFTIEGLEYGRQTIEAEKKSTLPLFKWNEASQVSLPSLSLQIPSQAFYEDVYTRFTYSDTNSLFPYKYHLGNPEIPLQKYAELVIDVSNVPPGLHKKLCLLYNDYKGDEYTYAGGECQYAELRARIRKLGEYTIGVDSLPPEIKAVNIHDKKNIRGYKTIKIKLTDDISGIKKYRSEINGHWALTEYDAKNDLLLCYPGRTAVRDSVNTYHLKVEDNNHNSSEYSVTFEY